MLTVSGDAPGQNGVIRAVTMRCVEGRRLRCVGLKRGWKGSSPQSDTLMASRVGDVRYILQEGGTIFVSSRTKP